MSRPSFDSLVSDGAGRGRLKERLRKAGWSQAKTMKLRATGNPSRWYHSGDWKRDGRTLRNAAFIAFGIR